jgi:hypothetical protein
MDELLAAPDRTGWRGNTAAWVQRVRAWMRSGEATAAALARLAPAVDSWRLLRPAVACAVPLHRHRLFNPLWNDVRHVLLRAVPPSSGAEVLDVWIGCLVYLVRRRPRMGLKTIRHLRPPAGALRRALQPGCWHPSGVDGDEERCRTRALMVLRYADESATEDNVREATEWLHHRPSSEHLGVLRDVPS